MKSRNIASQRFVVLGLGSFGTACALRLSRNGARVTGVDRNQAKINGIQGDLFEAVIGDATDVDLLKALDLPSVTSVVISMGEDITRSTLAAMHAKELGATHLIAKGISVDHGRLLKLIGIDRVVYPETEMATQVADQLTWPHVIDFSPIGGGFGFVEVVVPEGFVGKSIQECESNKLEDLWLVGVRDTKTSELVMFPDKEFQLTAEHMILAVGKEASLRSLCDFE